MVGSKGSSGFGSFINEDIDRRTLEIDNAGLQLSFNISTHILPAELILGWYILVIKLHLGALNG